MFLFTLLGCQLHKSDSKTVITEQSEEHAARSETLERGTKAQVSNVEHVVHAEKILYVQSSVANLRAEASVKSNILSSMPIGTKGEVVKQQDGWVHFQTEEHIGWVSTSLLGATEPTLEYALAQFEAIEISNPSERRKWIERAAALAPKNKDVIEMLIHTLEEQGDSSALRKAQLGLRKLKELDAVYFTNNSFQDGSPDDYLEMIPSLLSCREEIRDLGIRDAEPPSEQMMEKWGSWGREVPKQEFWPVLHNSCFEFHPKKSIWSLIVADGVASWKLLDLEPKLTVRTYLTDPCVGEQTEPPYSQVNLSLKATGRQNPELYLSTIDTPNTANFPFPSLTIPEAKPVPGLVSPAGNSIHRSVLSGTRAEFGIRSVYLESEVGDQQYEDGMEKDAVGTISLVVEWESGERAVLHTAHGVGKYSYHPPYIDRIKLTDINHDGFPDFLFQAEDIGYVLVETRQQSIHLIHTIEIPKHAPIGGC